MIQFAYNQKEVNFLRQILTSNSRYSMNEKKVIKE